MHQTQRWGVHRRRERDGDRRREGFVGEIERERKVCSKDRGWGERGSELLESWEVVGRPYVEGRG